MYCCCQLQLATCKFYVRRKTKVYILDSSSLIIMAMIRVTSDTGNQEKEGEGEKRTPG